MAYSIPNLCSIIEEQEKQLQRVIGTNKKLMETIKAKDSLFKYVHIDLSGPLFDEDDNEKYVVVVIDPYSHWVEAIAIMNCTADTVTEAFYDCWVSRFGAPKGVTVGNKTQFRSKIFKRYIRDIGAIVVNGLFVKDYDYDCVKTAIDEYEGDDWDIQLPSILLQQRSKHTSNLCEVQYFNDWREKAGF